MERAVVLINTTPGGEEEVLRDIRGSEGVVEVHQLYGLYDIIAMVQGENEEKVKSIIAYKLRAHPKVVSTLTMRVTSSS